MWNAVGKPLNHLGLITKAGEFCEILHPSVGSTVFNNCCEEANVTFETSIASAVGLATVSFLTIQEGWSGYSHRGLDN